MRRAKIPQGSGTSSFSSDFSAGTIVEDWTESSRHHQDHRRYDSDYSTRDSVHMNNNAYVDNSRDNFLRHRIHSNHIWESLALYHSNLYMVCHPNRISARVTGKALKFGKFPQINDFYFIEYLALVMPHYLLEVFIGKPVNPISSQFWFIFFNHNFHPNRIHSQTFIQGIWGISVVCGHLKNNILIIFGMLDGAWLKFCKVPEQE